MGDVFSLSVATYAQNIFIFALNQISGDKLF